MKKILSLLTLLACISMTSVATENKKSVKITKIHAVGGNIKIKIKNDTDDEVTVYSGSGNSSYRLQKNIVTTISMEEGAKLFDYNGGKKGRVLLTVSADMDGKLQLYSKL
jgi:ABC-type Fe3+-hydroxamate transport system substrate-binding protein